mgnify:FL=1
MEKDTCPIDSNEDNNANYSFIIEILWTFVLLLLLFWLFECICRDSEAIITNEVSIVGHANSPVRIRTSNNIKYNYPSTDDDDDDDFWDDD